MADGGACVSEATVVFRTDNVASPRKHQDSYRIPTSPSSFQGSKSQDNMNPSASEEGSFFPPYEKEESNGEDDYGSLQQLRKKRRLTLKQVEYLEKKFEVENKLEPDRKVELAKRLGLQPRQVAIWFQNRRARLKTKQLEKDYGELKCRYDKLMADYDNLRKDNDDLKMKINEMKEELLAGEKKTQKNNGLEKLKVMAFPVEGDKSPFSNSDSKQVCNSTMAINKQEEISSDKSDVFDSESPFNAENHSSLMEAATSLQSEFSQDEEENFTGTLFPSVFPNLEDDEGFPERCSSEFPAEEQSFCFWSNFSSEI